MKRLFIYSAFLGLLLTSNGCSDKLNLTPSTQLPTESAVSDSKGVQAATAGMYSGMLGTSYYGRTFLTMGELTGDNIYLAAKNSNRYTSTYRYLWLTTDGDAAAVWNTGYNIILRANNVINNIDNVKDFADGEKDSYLGQALFIRALVHFDLVRLFAEPYIIGGGSQLGIPYITKFEVGTPKRNTVTEVYTNIIADLTQAKTLLAAAGTADPFTASGNAASALLARVYLYQGNNAGAVSEATNVINAGYTVFDATADPTGYADFFNTPGTTEDIFTIKYLPSQTNGTDNYGNMYIKPGYGDFRVSPALVSTYEPTDARLTTFISAFNGSPTEYQNNKFTGQDGLAGLYSVKILRLSEMYLIRAEANAKLSNFGPAVDDINYIRERRNLTDLVIADADVLTTVEGETRKEFAFEGHRYFDLLRNKQDIDRQYCGHPTQISGAPCLIPATGLTSILPIPQSEINVNPNMEQNPGYKQ